MVDLPRGTVKLTHQGQVGVFWGGGLWSWGAGWQGASNTPRCEEGLSVAC
jgi:hypothetical protein